MRVENFFTILIAFGLLVNCFGLGTDKKNSGLDKNAENLLLADYLNNTKVEYLEINGLWKDEFNFFHYIYAEKNSFSGLYGFWGGLINPVIVEFDNNTKTLYVKGIGEPIFGEYSADCNGNGIGGEPGVECYSRIVWTKYNNDYYYCEIVYNKGSLEEAKRDSTTADSSNLASGCGGFSWTKFDQKLN